MDKLEEILKNYSNNKKDNPSQSQPIKQRINNIRQELTDELNQLQSGNEENEEQLLEYELNNKNNTTQSSPKSPQIQTKTINNIQNIPDTKNINNQPPETQQITQNNNNNNN
eukprot:454111_1